MRAPTPTATPMHARMPPPYARTHTRLPHLPGSASRRPLESAAPDLCRARAGGRPHAGRLQHPRRTGGHAEVGVASLGSSVVDPECIGLPRPAEHCCLYQSQFTRMLGPPPARSGDRAGERALRVQHGPSPGGQPLPAGAAVLAGSGCQVEATALAGRDQA